MGDSVTSQLSEAMNRLWHKFLPQMEERVATLEGSAARLASGVLSDEEKATAAGEAHKLAGVLGTFGLKEGTELAREAEVLYAGALDAKSDTTARLVAIAEQLKSMIVSR